jgi:ribosome biogenesis GTPase
VDTPGMRELGMIADTSVIADSFSDIQQLSESCRFNDCSHTTEVGCAILQSMKDGELEEERYRSYLKLIKESEFHQMSYAERRKKDKQFGRMVNVAMKQLKKRKPSAQ